ncbi:MAG: hypothetical protein QW416_03215 [Candidatus Nitrosocaldaceae archaeon]
MQSIINDNDKQQLLDLAKITANNYKIEACCIYGSKVAGYARPDSDYDILLVLKDYNELIKYIYVHDKDTLDASLLIVDSKALLNDAIKASLGEFVAGRLLHPYEPLINNEYLINVETFYKKRVIIECIMDLTKTAFYRDIIIPIRYFLLAKIKKRAKIYPHALYSYIKTYTSEQGTKNLEISLNGFTRALRTIEGEYIRFYDKDNVIVNKELRTKLLSTTFSDGLFAYLVHFYAGRKTLNFFKQEAKSKMMRRKEINSINYEFVNPESILWLDDTILLHKDDWFNELLEKMNIHEYSLKIDKIGDIHATTKLYTINNKLKLVGKYYASRKSLKWIGLNVWMINIKKFDTNSTVRQNNEYKAIKILRQLSLNVPEIVGLSYKHKITITKYIEGVILNDIILSILLNKSEDTSKIYEFGSLLNKIHKHGYTIRDTKASNIIINNDKLYLTDLEQFVKSNDFTWDLVCFLYYSLKFTDNIRAARMIVRAFLDGYSQDIDKKVIKDAARKRYIPQFYPAMTLDIIKVIRDEILNIIS